jgi:hypothetical protein
MNPANLPVRFELADVVPFFIASVSIPTGVLAETYIPLVPVARRPEIDGSLGWRRIMMHQTMS